MNDAPFEFTCLDCNTPVYRYGRFEPNGEEPQRCLVCYWIHMNPEMPEEHKKFLRELDTPGVPNDQER